MRIDWITWGVWAFGVSLLLTWCFQTFREFRALFSKRKSQKTDAPEE